MRGFLLSLKTAGIAFSVLVGAAVAVGGWVNPTIAYILLGAAFVWLVCAIVHWWRNRDRPESRVVVGGLIGRANNVRIRDSSSRTRIKTSGRPEEVAAGGLVGQGEDVEIADSSADTEVEYEQNER